MPDSRLSSHLLPLRDQASETYAQDLIESGCRVHLPELLSAVSPDAIYQHPVRHGVRVIVFPTTSLRPQQLIAIMTFRLAQYLSVRHVDPHAVFCAQMRHEPLRYVGPNDLHILSLEAATGAILSYLTLRTAPPAAATGTSGTSTLRCESRSLFPLEEYFGWGIFNHLPLLPDLPVDRVRESARFMKNQRVHSTDELGARGSIELGAALSHLLVTGLLRQQIDALIGDFEEHTSMQNLLYFHTPLFVLRREAAAVSATAYMAPRYRFHTIYPYAILVADCGATQQSRLEQVEQALSIPGRQGLRALLALRHDAHAATSSLSKD